LDGILSRRPLPKDSSRKAVSCALAKLVAEGQLAKYLSLDGRCPFRKPDAA